MYANHYGPTSPPSEFSNNPFINDPANAHARFPDISGSTFSSPQSPPQVQPGYTNGYGNAGQYQLPQAQYQQYPSQPYPNQYQAPPQMPDQNQFASTSFAPQSSQPGQMIPAGYGFQPSSSFGQQPQSQPQQYAFQSGYQNQQYPGYQGYPQQSGSAGYLSEFDPYAQQPQSQSSSQLTMGSAGDGPANATHPRDFIRMHKAGLEAWDSHSWKQLFNAWSGREQQAEAVIQQMGGALGPDPRFAYNSQLEGWKQVSVYLVEMISATFNHESQVLKEANNNFDTVAASTFQLHEVFKSYRQSGDATSKRRVRESCNAALKGLPDWPTN
ncbi:hypothetical protein BS17DRAFT_136977 [Gyrodon lividus]|nr:hypothetical protein BS17DRAFT_136977 [Gyrodon lividus]